MKASDALVTIGLGRNFGDRKALCDLSIAVRSGEIYGFLGPNGAGKRRRSDAFWVCCLPTQVLCLFLVKPIVLRRKRVGAMVETPAFHAFLSGRANLALSAAYAGEDTANLDGLFERVGLLERADDRVADYSLGMRQRLGLARALIGEPKLLILDEPTNGMDPRGIKEVRDVLLGLSRDFGVTIFVSSHLLAEVQQMFPGGHSSCRTAGIRMQRRWRPGGPILGGHTGCAIMKQLIAAEWRVLMGRGSARGMLVVSAIIPILTAVLLGWAAHSDIAWNGEPIANTFHFSGPHAAALSCVHGTPYFSPCSSCLSRALRWPRSGTVTCSENAWSARCHVTRC